MHAPAGVCTSAASSMVWLGGDSGAYFHSWLLFYPFLLKNNGRKQVEGGAACWTAPAPPVLRSMQPLSLGADYVGTPMPCPFCGGGGDSLRQTWEKRETTREQGEKSPHISGSPLVLTELSLQRVDKPSMSSECPQRSFPGF